MFFNCLEKPKRLWSLLKSIKFTFVHLPRLPLLETLCRIHRGSPLNEKEYIYYLCGAGVYICRYMCGITCVEIRRHFSRVLFFHFVSLRDWILVFSFGGKYFYWLRHITGPTFSFTKPALHIPSAATPTTISPPLLVILPLTSMLVKIVPRSLLKKQSLPELLFDCHLYPCLPLSQTNHFYPSTPKVL